MSPPGTTPAQLIGNKGLGFTSVLELTEEPQIHSGPFHFHFSTAETRELLRKHITLYQDPPPLTFRIPHPMAVSAEVEDRLDKEYVTVIYLPLREEARSKVHMQSAPRLYWSEREVSKAKDLRGRYFMALLSPNGEAIGYNVGWLWNPLNDLRECWEKRTISGVWIWGEGRKFVDFHELSEEPWQIPNPRAHQAANNFSFEIKLNGLKCAATGLEAILTRLPLGNGSQP
jgi:hypothetical protein